jgi:hypothetical protein
MRKVHWISSSNDKKIGKVLASYSSKSTCPDTCSLKTGGCYAWGLFYLNILSSKIEDGRIKSKSLKSALLERSHSAKIARHRVAGDVVDDVESTVEECLLIEKEKIINIGYTHHWRSQEAKPLKKWFRASCQTFEEVLEARAAGWSTTLIMDQSAIPSKSFKMQNNEMAYLCPARIGEVGKKDITCNDCTLCRVDDKTKNKTVVFAAHGNAATLKKIKNKI